MERFISKSPEDTEKIGQDLGQKIQSGVVIAFKGGLGMGKTCFTRGLAKGLASSDTVTSPTFALINEYLSGRLPLYHFDMYRISGWDDLYSTGYFDYLDAGNCLIIEWSENIEAILPEDCIRVTITKTENFTERNIEITGAEAFENFSN